jgi:hypothetical protein
MRKTFFVWLLLCAGILAGCASDRQISQPTQLPEERCDLPVWETGDYWVYRVEGGKEFGWRVTGVTERLYVVGVASNKEHRLAFDKRTLEFGEYEGSRDKKAGSLSGFGLSFDFPLFVGKKWDRMITGETDRHIAWNYLMSYRVVSFEAVKVPAGTFKAFKIEQTQKDLGSGGEAISYYWFSPEAKNIIRYRFGTSYGAWHINSKDYELISYRVRKAEDQNRRLSKPGAVGRTETERRDTDQKQALQTR